MVTNQYSNQYSYELFCPKCRKRVDVFAKPKDEAKTCPSCNHEFDEAELQEAMAKSKVFKKKPD
jgi:rRNA maturation endonuclease Nob1